MINVISVEILGTRYDIFIEPEDSNVRYQVMCGWTDWTAREIHVGTPEKDKYSMEHLQECVNKVIRHEIIHAYLHESGLDNNSSPCDAWALNEEMVDWSQLCFQKLIVLILTCFQGYIRVPKT